MRSNDLHLCEFICASYLFWILEVGNSRCAAVRTVPFCARTRGGAGQLQPGVLLLQNLDDVRVRVRHVQLWPLARPAHARPSRKYLVSVNTWCLSAKQRGGGAWPTWERAVRRHRPAGIHAGIHAPPVSAAQTHSRGSRRCAVDECWRAHTLATPQQSRSEGERCEGWASACCFSACRICICFPCKEEET